MKHVPLELDYHFNELLEKWGKSLEANRDDFVYVDGEEGDFGVVRYFGFDVDGNADVHMMTRYIEGGDIESTYYTTAGADMVQKILRQNFETVLRKQLEENLDPGSQAGMYPGFFAEMKKAEKHLTETAQHITGEIGCYVGSHLPETIEHNQIFKYGWRLFKAFVTKEREDRKQTIGFRNLMQPNQYLAFQRIRDGEPQDMGTFMLPLESWNAAFERGSVVIAETHDPVTPGHFPANSPILKVLS